MKRPIFGLLLILSAACLYAAQVPANFGYEQLDDFSYGLVTTPNSDKVTKKAATKMRNCYIDKKPGSILKGLGYSVLGTAPGVAYFRYGWDLILSDGSKKFLIFGSTSATPTASSGILLETKDFNSYTTVKNGISALLDLDSAQVFYKRWFTNGNDPVFTWDGTSVVVLNGTNGTPNVPKGKYIAFYQRSVWVYNLSDNDSQARFSAPVDTTPAAIAQNPDSVNAWPATYGLNFDRGDGTAGTFIRAYKGKLFVGKERAIYFVSGTGASSYQPVKTSALVGFLSQFSTFELDNYLYGHSYDGFYRFDGANTERLSDDIFPDIQNIKNDTTRNLSNIWETQTDFNRGAFGITSATTGGVLHLDNSKSNANVNPAVQLTGDAFYIGTSWGFYAVVPTFTFTSDRTYIFSNPTFKFFVAGGGGTCVPGVVVMNTNTQASSTGTFTDALAATHMLTLNFSNFTTSFTAAELNSNKLSIKFYESAGTCSGYQIYVPTTPSGALIAFTSSGSYISDVATATTVSNWGLFSSNNSDNGGDSQFYIRTATSLVQLATQTWSAISPGAVINASSTNNYIQWAATITGEAQIENVTIEHTEGSGSNTRTFGVGWLGRPWFGVSTETTGNYPMIYVMSRKTNPNPHAWMPFEGIPVRGFLSSGQILYGFHGSQAQVLRLDYGTNYGGNVIDAYYETPDLVLGDGAFKKDIWEYELDLQKENGATLTLGTSLNSGAFGNNTISLNGSGPLYAVVKNPNGGGGTYCNTVKLRFGNAELDKGMQVNGASIIYRKTAIR